MSQNEARNGQPIRMTIKLSTSEKPRGRTVVLQVADRAEADRISRESRLFLARFQEMALPWEKVVNLFRRPEQRARVIAGLRPLPRAAKSR